MMRQLIGCLSALCFANVPHRLDDFDNSLKSVNVYGGA
jgi:hypothetical protein